MEILSSAYTIIGIIFLAAFTIPTLAGSMVAYRVAYHRGMKEIEQKATEIEERVNNALQAEIKLLRDKMTDLEKENLKLSQTLGLIKAALRKRGLSVTIDGDLITIHDASGSSQTGRITGQGD